MTLGWPCGQLASNQQLYYSETLLEVNWIRLRDRYFFFSITGSSTPGSCGNNPQLSIFASVAERFCGCDTDAAPYKSLLLLQVQQPFFSSQYPDDDPDYCIWVPPAGTDHFLAGSSPVTQESA